MATKAGSFCTTHAILRNFRHESGLAGTLPLCRINARLRGRGHQKPIILAFVLIFLIPSVIISAEPTMEIFVDHSSMAFSDVSPKTVKDIAKTNDLGAPDSWPVYGATGHPSYRLPESFIRREKDHPEWDLKRLNEYRIAFRTYADGKRKQRVVFLYRKEANVLFVLYDDIPEKSNDPNSPF